MYFASIKFIDAQISDSIETYAIKSEKYKSNTPSNLANIGNKLFSNDMLLTDCWHNNNSGYDHFADLRFFNKKFNTKIFLDVFEINFLSMHPKGKHCCEYIKIKEWCFSKKAKSLEAIYALQKINKSNIVFKMPTYWIFIQVDDKVYFVESNDFDLKSEYMQMVKNIIIQSSESASSSIVEFPK